MTFREIIFVTVCHLFCPKCFHALKLARAATLWQTLSLRSIPNYLTRQAINSNLHVSQNDKTLLSLEDSKTDDTTTFLIFNIQLSPCFMYFFPSEPFAHFGLIKVQLSF